MGSGLGQEGEMTHTYRRRRGGPVTSPGRLLEIAEVIDAVCATRKADPGTETAVRVALFAILDQPTQVTWEKVRDIEVMPHYLTGLTTPSPLGLTLADVVYMAGLSDLVCPSRTGLLTALRRAVAEHGDRPF